MKKLYLIGGPMGVGKTTVSQALKRTLPRCAFLDGDWCWDMHPFQVTEETKAMVLDNICHVLNNFLACAAYENVIFCWVMHRQEIIEAILSGTAAQNCEVKLISLIAGEEALVRRLRADVDRGIRQDDAIERSLSYLPLYENVRTEKLDVSEISPEEAAERIRWM